MELVQPIRDKEIIDKFKVELLKDGYRNYLLFVIGINTGLRISDILPLKVKDVTGTHIMIKEKKTGKNKRFKINENLRAEIGKYICTMQNDEYLFPSRKGDKPITRVQAYRILNKVADKLGINEIGTHTLRKTFGYWHYQQHKDVAILQEIFNHSSPSVTLRYIGINSDIIDSSIDNFYL
ncbi:MAG: site-specific integrase [Romboutsia timonensis]|uniref:site-specific integrase n=1 Tax=Romboutsia timonensis TaxID=1776391 RepID=UPI002A760776|nr:site-specific integrase [Romboutsia timonensis]MDY2883719.1 site-specific integrase [Romboutsia timonensis]